MQILSMDNSRKSFLVSCLIHAILLFGTAGMMIQPPRYDVQPGSGGMEVNLIGAPLPSSGSQKPAGKQSLEQSAPAAVPTAPSSPTTLYLPGGALGGKNGRLKNPAPAYPYEAIRQDQQGVVLLEVSVDVAGRPTSVEIVQSSGFPLLDDSALRTVKRWKFDPAHVGLIRVDAKIRIPVRFILDRRFR